MNRHSWALMTCLFALTACGGGDDNPPVTNAPSSPSAPPLSPPSKAEGAYQAKLTGQTGSSDAWMLVLENDEAWVLYGDEIGGTFYMKGFISGVGRSSNGTYTSSSLKDYRFFPAINGTLSSSYDSRGAISGTTRWTNGSQTSTVNFTAKVAEYNYHTPANMANVVGTWTVNDLSTGSTASLNVGTDGRFTLADRRGCSAVGTVKPRPTGKNVFDLTITFGGSPCLLANRRGTGVGIWYRSVTGKATLLAAIKDESKNYGLAAYGTR